MVPSLSSTGSGFAGSAAVLGTYWNRYGPVSIEHRAGLCGVSRGTGYLLEQIWSRLYRAPGRALRGQPWYWVLTGTDTVPSLSSSGSDSAGSAVVLGTYWNRYGPVSIEHRVGLCGVSRGTGYLLEQIWSRLYRAPGRALRGQPWYWVLTGTDMVPSLSSTGSGFAGSAVVLGTYWNRYGPVSIEQRVGLCGVSRGTGYLLEQIRSRLYRAPGRALRGQPWYWVLTGTDMVPSLSSTGSGFAGSAVVLGTYWNRYGPVSIEHRVGLCGVSRGTGYLLEQIWSRLYRAPGRALRGQPWYWVLTGTDMVPSLSSTGSGFAGSAVVLGTYWNRYGPVSIEHRAGLCGVSRGTGYLLEQIWSRLYRAPGRTLRGQPWYWVLTGTDMVPSLSSTGPGFAGSAVVLGTYWNRYGPVSIEHRVGLCGVSRGTGYLLEQIRSRLYRAPGRALRGQPRYWVLTGTDTVPSLSSTGPGFAGSAVALGTYWNRYGPVSIEHRVGLCGVSRGTGYLLEQIRSRLYRAPGRALRGQPWYWVLTGTDMVPSLSSTGSGFAGSAAVLGTYWNRYGPVSIEHRAGLCGVSRGTGYLLEQIWSRLYRAPGRALRGQPWYWVLTGTDTVPSLSSTGSGFAGSAVVLGTYWNRYGPVSIEHRGRALRSQLSEQHLGLILVVQNVTSRLKRRNT